MSICLACGNCSLRSPYHAENATDKNHPVSAIKVEIVSPDWRKPNKYLQKKKLQVLMEQKAIFVNTFQRTFWSLDWTFLLHTLLYWGLLFRRQTTHPLATAQASSSRHPPEV